MTQFPNCSIWKKPPGVLMTQLPDCSIWKSHWMTSKVLPMMAPGVLVTQFPHCSIWKSHWMKSPPPPTKLVIPLAVHASDPFG